MRNWVSQRFEFYARACVIAAIFIAPIIFQTRSIGAFGVTKLTVLWSFMVVGLSLWGIWRLDSHIALPKSRLIRLSVVFVAISALATAFSPYRLTALVGNFYVYGGLVSLEAYFVLLFLVFALYWRRPFQLEELCKAGAIAGFLVSGYQLLQETGLDWNVWTVGGGAAPWAGGTLGNPNFTGGFLGATLPFALYLTVKAKDVLTRRLLVSLICLQLVAVWLTASRGGIACAIAGCAAFAFCYRDRIPRVVKRGLAGAAAIVLILGAVAVSQAKSDPSAGGETTVLGVSTSPKALLETRVDFWRAAVKIIIDHPILGTGPDTFYANYPSARPPENGGDPTLQLENNPHNIFLAHAVGSGIPGLVSYLLIMGTALAIARRRLGARPEPRVKLLLVTFTSALIAYLTQGLVSIDHVPLAMLGWVCVGALAILADPSLEQARTTLERELEIRARQGSKPRYRRKLPVPVTAICIAALVFLSLGARLMLADIRAQSARTSTSLTDKVTLIKEAFELNPAESQYHLDAGTILHSVANAANNKAEADQIFRQARAQFLQALARRPRSVLVLVSIARMDSDRGQLVDKQHFVTAASSWRRVLAIDPHNYRWHFQYAQMLGRAAEADNNNRQLRLAEIAELEEAIRIRRPIPQAWRMLATAYDSIGNHDKAVELNDTTPAPQLLPIPAVPVAPPVWRSSLGLWLSYLVPLGVGFEWMRRRQFSLQPAVRPKSKKIQNPDLLSELIAGAGVWSVAVALPHMGVFLGAGLSRGDLRELLLHLIPGFLAIYLGLRGASKPFVGRFRSGVLDQAVPFATFVCAIGAVAAHLPELFSGGVSPAEEALSHMVPLIAIFALVSKSVSQSTYEGAPPAPAGSEARESADIS